MSENVKKSPAASNLGSSPGDFDAIAEGFLEEEFAWTWFNDTETEGTCTEHQLCGQEQCPSFWQLYSQSEEQRTAFEVVGGCLPQRRSVVVLRLQNALNLSVHP